MMIKEIKKIDLYQYLQESQDRITNYFQTVINQFKCHSRLDDAFFYSLMGGGKRLRPFLVYCVADFYDIPHEEVDPVAAAIEFVHCYSLVHDDLPSMDNADLRRGKPSCWKQFDTATGILVGDALLTAAFELISDASHLGAAARTSLISMLSKKIGSQGMVGGQMYDLYPAVPKDISSILDMQHLKTGCLISASCQASAIVAGATQAELDILSQFGFLFGRIFQITDDILDIEGDVTIIGKPTQQDCTKNTLINLLGLTETKELLQEMVQDSQKLLDQLPHHGGMLQQIIPWVLERKK